jgi:hypothetical protein
MFFSPNCLGQFGEKDQRLGWGKNLVVSECYAFNNGSGKFYNSSSGLVSRLAKGKLENREGEEDALAANPTSD